LAKTSKSLRLVGHTQKLYIADRQKFHFQTVASIIFSLGDIFHARRRMRRWDRCCWNSGCEDRRPGDHGSRRVASGSPSWRPPGSERGEVAACRKQASGGRGSLDLEALFFSSGSRLSGTANTAGSGVVGRGGSGGSTLGGRWRTSEVALGPPGVLNRMPMTMIASTAKTRRALAKRDFYLSTARGGSSRQRRVSVGCRSRRRPGFERSLLPHKRREEGELWNCDGSGSSVGRVVYSIGRPGLRLR